jgi:hypothetical protein
MMKSFTPRRGAPIEEPRPVNFYGIEIETPAQSFWRSLARLLFTMAAAARRKGEGRQ